MPKSSCLKWTYGRPVIDYRVAANITEYQNNLPKFIEKKQLFHVKNVCKNVKNQQV